MLEFNDVSAGCRAEWRMVAVVDASVCPSDLVSLALGRNGLSEPLLEDRRKKNFGQVGLRGSRGSWELIYIVDCLACNLHKWTLRFVGNRARVDGHFVRGNVGRRQGRTEDRMAQAWYRNREGRF